MARRDCIHIIFSVWNADIDYNFYEVLETAIYEIMAAFETLLFSIDSITESVVICNM